MNAFEKRYSAADTGVSYRTLNTWRVEGVLPDSRKDSKKWQKFSMLDIFWLLIVSSLRETGVPLKRISKIKNMIFKKRVDDETMLFRAWKMIQWDRFWVIGKDVFLVIYDDDAICVTASPLITRKHNHICLNLTQMAREKCQKLN